MRGVVEDFITPEEQEILLRDFSEGGQWLYKDIVGIKQIIVDRILDHLGFKDTKDVFVRYESNSYREKINWHRDTHRMTDDSPCHYGCCIMLSKEYMYTGGLLKYRDVEIDYKTRSMAYHTGDEEHCVTKSQGVRKTFLIFI